MWLMLSNKLTYIQLNHLIEIHDIINMYVVVKFHKHNFTRLLIWNQKTCWQILSDCFMHMKM